jgi:hypothetical protein
MTNDAGRKGGFAIVTRWAKKRADAERQSQCLS